MRIPFTALTVAAAALAAVSVPASVRAAAVCVVPNDKIPTSRPPEADRLFRSKVLERRIAQTAARISDPELRRMFQQCLPNTLDTTVHPGRTADGDDDTFVVTGDIDAMWLRDSGAQVWPYLRFAKDDPELRRLIRGVIRRQFRSLVLDPYANAFLPDTASTATPWAKDYTDMRPGVFERKYELDSLCYPLRLAYAYWKVTGDDSIFDDLWLRAIDAVLATMREQQHKEGFRTSYNFQRRGTALHDTMANYGYGHPAKPVGLIASAFRPSDDSCVLPYLVPSNFMAVSCLRKAAEAIDEVNHRTDLAQSCRDLAAEVQAALNRYAVVNHPKYGPIYAFEVDGFGGALLMDDANVPSLLALPYISDVPLDDPVYQNTRRFAWSEDNPYFFRGRAGEGIGSPHTSFDNVWPMSVIMRAMTATDPAEVDSCLTLLKTTTAGTGFMHESFNKDDDSKFTRAWFAWVNTLFGELILKLDDAGHRL